VLDRVLGAEKSGANPKSFRGRVVSVATEGNVSEVRLLVAGDVFAAVVPHNELDAERALTEGRDVSVTFEPDRSAVRISPLPTNVRKAHDAQRKAPFTQ
jgi:hypothetical protein